MIPVVAGSNPVGHPRKWRRPALRRAAPAPALQALLGAALQQIEHNAQQACKSPDGEFLHQLRVGLRRLRAALRAFRRILPRKETKRLVRALRKLSPKLGTARDWDVLAARLEADGGSEALLRKAQARRATARRAARRAIVSKRFAGIGPAVRGLAAADSRETLAQFGAAALARAHRKLMAQADRADWADAAARHAVRIRIKRLRYSCEFFASAFPSRLATPYIAALKELQEILGALNDITVGRRLIGFDADEAVLLRGLGVAWPRLAKRPVFWREPA